jgi:serine/threonine-protein kinase
LIGETLGQRYKLLRLLGRGGMGAVYEAEQTGTLDRVAVKVLHGHLLVPGGDGPRRFRREAEAVRAIRSDHIVRVLDTGADEARGDLYLVTELLDGEDLQALLDRAGVLSVPGALGIAAQALRGLEEAHAAGVVHRDIKPANIFLAKRPDGTSEVKLVDFGIAKIRSDPLGPAATATLTAPHTFLGSPLYMSPEQVQNSRDVAHRGDLWSLGCVLYACLAGRAPHQDKTSVGQLLVAICVSPPPPLSEVAPWVPREVADVVHGALARRPEDRFPTAAAMLEAIRSLGPSSSLAPDALVSSGRSPHVVRFSSAPPSPLAPSPRVVVAAADPGRPIRADAATEVAVYAPVALPPGAATLDSAPDRLPARGSSLPEALPARSGVPAVGARTRARLVTVDPRRILGQSSELWTFSLDVHRHMSSLIARIWKSMRRAGADVPPMTYGKTWVLFEPRTGRSIAAEVGEGGAQQSLADAGIRPGTVLWILRPDESAAAG